ncbi:MAG: hypothetical protein B9S33_01040 [Pedosphaera sp. Tous-C6FEB]|nr:MAG: hypothetical protein B9S33_01040 [Pedosphaera sp. Tous-C6FEB]
MLPAPSSESCEALPVGRAGDLPPTADSETGLSPGASASASDQSSPRRTPPKEFFSSEREARSYQWVSLGLLLAIYVLLAGWLAGRLPVWVLVTAVPILYVRCALVVHELMHVRGAAEVFWIQRLMMILDSPMCLGYREYRDIHLRHHRHAGTEVDPEFFQIRGGHLRAFLNALLATEIAFVHLVRERGMAGELAWLATVRALVFFGLLFAFPAAFLVYLVTIRLVIGVSNFLFHHATHARAGSYGNFPLRPPRWVDKAFCLLAGTALRHILFEHDSHHAWQQVKAERLPGLLDHFPKPGFGSGAKG